MLSANLIDYSGRHVDLLMFDGFKAEGDTLVEQTLAAEGQNGALIAGIEKLTQRFLLELCTEANSLAYQKNRGCTFMSDARRGYWRTPGDVTSSFSAARLTIEKNLISDEILSDPLDERFQDAQILAVSVTLDKVALQIQVTSLAGDSRTVLWPLRFTSF